MEPLDGPPPPAPRPNLRADALERADLAWRARVAGATWENAAKVAGFTDRDNCERAVRRAYGQLPQPSRDQLRDLWRERLEALWRQAFADFTDRRPGAVTAGVRVVQAACALDGLPEPTRVDMFVTDTFDRLTAELAANDLLPGNG